MTEKQTPQIFPLLECMIAPFIFDQAKGRPSSHKEVSPSNDDCRASFSHVSSHAGQGSDNDDPFSFELLRTSCQL